MSARYRVAADTGGTFTDFVFLDELSGRLEIAKLPSTPADPSEAVAAGLAELVGRDGQADVVFFSHGTTVGTNALLEGKGARTGLLVTKGFRGIYEVQEQMRGYGSAVFDFAFRKPPLLAGPRDTLEVPERIGAAGEVVQPLDEATAHEIAEQASRLGIESLAVCLLFAFRNPEHESLLRTALAEAAPELPVSLSSEVLPQVREYYRLSTTVINAYLRPVLGRYLGQLEQRLGTLGLSGPQRYVMQSNGGVASLERAAERAVTTILSGPAGGVIAGQAIGRAAGRPNLINFDMGGTSCDVALVHDGQASVTSLAKVARRDVAVPMLDIHTVSAGGGTIARIERLGDLPRLRVGPESAGARPGPVAYRQGGQEPTITDASVVLGYLRPASGLGGVKRNARPAAGGGSPGASRTGGPPVGCARRTGGTGGPPVPPHRVGSPVPPAFANRTGGLRLDVEAAREALRCRLAEPLGLGLEAAAEGVLEVIDVQMEEAIKAISTRRGYDLRDFTLVAFGGAGPLHAARVARNLGIAEVLVPLYPGVTSALGLLLADIRHDYVRSRLEPLEALDPGVANEIFASLEAEAVADLEAEGFPPERRAFIRQVDLRYAGQGYEVSIAVPGGSGGSPGASRTGEPPVPPVGEPPVPAGLSGWDTVELRKRFDEEHERQFGHRAPDRVAEIVNYRLAGFGLVPPLELPRCPRANGPLESAQVGERTIYLSESGGLTRCPVYARERLGAGHRFVGPAIVEQLDATTLVLPGQEVLVDEHGNLLIRTADGAGERESGRVGEWESGRATTAAGAAPDPRRRSSRTADGVTSAGRRPPAAEDPVVQEVVSATLSGIVQEMQNALFRTGYSTVIRESQDASCALLDRQGRLMAQHVVLALHMGAFPAAVASLLRTYPAESLCEGDAFLVNHPYEGGVPHAPDMAIITPIFHPSGGSGELVGFSASMAHKSDIGGPVPGSCSGQARETFNEGLHLPLVRYQAAGVHNADLDRIIAANSRTPEVVLGDIHGQLGACRLGERRLGEALAKFGPQTLLTSVERLYARTEAQLRAAIAGWADGEAEAERCLDDDGVELGQPVRIRVRVRKRGDRVCFDFGESNAQTRGPANVRPPLVRAGCAFCLITLIDPHLAINDGLFRVVEIETRPGSVVDPRFPAPVNTYNPTMHALADAVFEALSVLAPERKTADGSGSRSIFFGGRRAESQRSYLLYELFGGGSGGRLGLDGVSGTTVNHTNGKIAPIEIVESEYPVRLTRFELIPDSGGAGQFRGGLGFAREYELLDEEARFAIRSTKHVIPPRGMDGGQDGRGGRCLAYTGSAEERELPTRYADLPLARGQRVRLETPGGGGYGDPLRRDPRAVLEDVRDGYVTPEAAEARYGVVLRPAGGHAGFAGGHGGFEGGHGGPPLTEVDEVETAARRARRRKSG